MAAIAQPHRRNPPRQRVEPKIQRSEFTEGIWKSWRSKWRRF